MRIDLNQERLCFLTLYDVIESAFSKASPAKAATL